MMWRVVVLAAIAAPLASCGAMFMPNPSFPVDAADAKEILSDLRDSPASLERPVVVFAGFQDPGFGSASVAAKLRRQFTDGTKVISVSFFGVGSFDDCRERAIRVIDAAFPPEDPVWTREVDVIGISMGGLVARHAARERDEGEFGRRLRINRLFTIGTPHRGANLATLPTFDRLQIDMRAGSDFLAALNDDPTSSDFEIIPYGRLGDTIVGVENVAPPGMQPWWLPNLPFEFAHLTSASDPRILADIAMRLRGEKPLTVGSPLPPPGDEADAQTGPDSRREHD